MALDDVVQDIAINKKSAITLFQNNQKEELNNLIDIYFTKGAEHIKKTLANPNSDEAKAVLGNIVLKREKDIVKNYNTDKFAPEAFDTLYEVLDLSQVEYDNDNIQTELEKVYNWNNLNDNAKKAIKETIKGKPLMFFVQLYHESKNNKEKLISNGVSKEKIKELQEQSEKEIESRINAYLPEWSEELRKELIEDAKNGGIIIKYLDAVEKEHVKYTNIPSEDKIEVGKDYINENLKQLGYASEEKNYTGKNKAEAAA
ncbi:hypothetical protein GF374_00425 [Candidatus Woesearchaeota archaeon]|nr:hypothetical protein [Candidatus Woesearchaeota archaeon]